MKKDSIQKLERLVKLAWVIVLLIFLLGSIYWGLRGVLLYNEEEYYLPILAIMFYASCHWCPSLLVGILSAGGLVLYILLHRKDSRSVRQSQHEPPIT